MELTQFLNKTLDEGATSVTVACVSSLTDEEGGIVVTHKTTLEDVMNAYQLQFPREAEAYLLSVKKTNESLHNSSGMSSNGSMMKLAEIPEFILWAMKAKNRYYWDDKRRLYSFIRQYPAFMVGEHRKKEHTGIILK